MATLTQKQTPRYEGRRVTREEYLDLPDDGFRYDMIEGVLHMSPSPFFSHAMAATNFMSTLLDYFRESHSGFIVQDMDIFLPDMGDVLRPDISLVLEKNKRIIMGHVHGAPDLVCEVLSDSTRERDLGIKANRYLTNGVKEYWILDPDNTNIQLWINHEDHWNKKILSVESHTTLQSELLPGLKISREEIFRGLPK